MSSGSEIQNATRFWVSGLVTLLGDGPSRGGGERNEERVLRALGACSGTCRVDARGIEEVTIAEEWDRLLLVLQEVWIGFC